MAVNDWVMQFLADILNVPVDRPRVTETTALGAAYLAGLQTGVFENLEQITGMWECERQFRPGMKPAFTEARYAGWMDAVRPVRDNGESRDADIQVERW